MSYHHKYELGQLIAEGTAKTFQANEIDTGRPVFVHLLGGVRDYAVLEAFLRKVRWLQSSSSSAGASKIVEVSEDAGSPYVVTEILDSFSSLRHWVDTQCHQASQESSSHWKAQIDECLAAADYKAAFEVARKAVTESPNNPELQRFEQAVTFLCRGLELCNQGRDEKGLELLWQAYKIEEENPHVRGVMVNSLLERAYSLIDVDWRAADELVHAVLRLDPNHESARIFSGRIESKREEYVAWCAENAESLQAQGRLEEAREFVEQGLAVCPGESRLAELRDKLPPTPPSPSGKQPSEAARPRGPASGRPDEAKPKAPRAATSPQLSSLALKLRPLLGAAAVYVAKALLPIAEAFRDRLRPYFERLEGFLRKKLPWLASALDEWKTARRRVPLLPAAAGLAAAVTLITTGWVLWSRSAPIAPPALHAVTIRCNPAEATILVDGEVCGNSVCQLELAAGSYRAEARLAGYQPAMASFKIDDSRSQGQTASVAAPIDLTLVPLPALIRLSSDLAGARISLDGEPVGQLEDGSFELELAALERGEHTLTVSDRGSTAAITFETAPGRLPIIRGPVETRNLKAVVVTGLGAAARLLGQDARAVAAVNGESMGEVGNEGLSLTDLTEGPHDITLEAGQDQQKLVFEAGPYPTLAAYLKSDRNVGALRIVTNEDAVNVYLNGKKYRRATRRGGLLLYLYPNTYRVRVEKDGFESPPEQVAEVRKGEDARLEFSLTPKPRTAVLVIRNGVPGAEVWLNNTSLGTVQPSGHFSSPGIPEGTHAIALQKDNYKLKRVQREFVAGTTVELDGALETTLGVLEIELDPPGVDARLTLRREGETLERAISGRRLQLTGATYTVTATAEGYQDFAATLRVVPSETKVARLELTPKVKERVEVAGLKHWEDNGGWLRTGDVLVRRGGKFVLAPVEPRPGVYEFSARIERGRRLEWVVNYRDDGNYELFQMGKDFFHRIQVSAGKKSKPVKVRHPLGRDAYFRVRVEVTPNSIVHRILQNGEWAVIDRWGHNGADFTQGKFGFHIGKRDEIALADFSFVPGR